MINRLVVIILAFTFSAEWAGCWASSFSFDDKEFKRSLIQSKAIPLNELNNTLAKAKTGNKESIKQLIFGSAQNEFLLPLLDVYGEDQFYEECIKDPELYGQFFMALVKGYIKGNPFNLMEGFADKDQYYLARILTEETDNLQYRLWFSPFYAQFANTFINIKHLQKLLEKNFEIKSKRGSEDYIIKSAYNYYINIMAGDIEADLGNDTNALRFYNGCSTNINDLHQVRKAEILLGARSRTLLTISSKDRQEAIKLLKNASKESRHAANIRLSQYHLGVFGKVEEEGDHHKAAIKQLHNLTKGSTNHIAYRLLAEYHLGIYNPERLEISIDDITKAVEYLNKGIEALRDLPEVQECFWFRLAEIALGYYGEKINPEKAVEYCEKADNPFLLYRLYSGYYSPEYINPVRADEALEKGCTAGYDGLQMRKAIKLYEAGDIAGAKIIWEENSTIVCSQYYLARIHSNPESGFFEPLLAYHHYMQISNCTFRDSKKRLSNLLHNHFGFSAVEIKKIIKKRLRDIDLLEKIESRNKAAELPTGTEEVEAVIPEPIEDEPITTEEVVMHPDEDSPDVVGMLVVDNTAPFLSPDIESGMDKLNGTWRESELFTFCRSLEATIDVKRKSIYFPDMEVFTFHAAHYGPFKLEDYRARLKRMIRERYEIMVAEEASKLRAQAEAARGAPPMKGKKSK